MNRTELERLDRDALIARAEAHGVSRARILTRPELVDELLMKDAALANDGRDVQRVRGLFGRARDLLARVVERGLHLPDAADRLRGRGSPALPSRSGAATPLPTVTLAEIYAAQGHRERAIDTLKNVIDREPEHAPARALLDRLEDAAYQGPKARALPPEDDDLFAARLAAEDDADDNAPHATPVGTRAPSEATDTTETPDAAELASDVPLPPTYEPDECVAIPVDPQTLFVRWEVRNRTLEHLAATRAGGALALRALVISPTWDGPATAVRDADLKSSLGEAFVSGLPVGAVVRTAVGWRVGADFFPIAHSPVLETPPGEPNLVRWTLRGATPVDASDRDAPAIERALAHARARVSGERQADSHA